MEPEPAHPDFGRRRLPNAAAEVAAPHRLTVGAREHETVSARQCVQVDVHGERAGDERGHADRALPGGGLRRAERQLAVHLGELPRNGDEVALEVDVTPTQPGELAPPKPWGSVTAGTPG
jgi:hypothetical protein